MSEMKYDPITDTTPMLRFYELFRGIGNAIMNYIQMILVTLGIWKPEESTEGE